MEADKVYQQASIATANDLKTIAQSLELREISRLSLPEIDAVVDVVSRVIPAGNVPGIIATGLARLPGRRPPVKTVQRDVNLLFKSLEQTLDTAVYGAFFMAPARIIYGYQNLLKLAGKDPEDSFPDGTWQFYVDYALREDTARHSNEVDGFDALLNEHDIRLSQVDRMTAWTMAAAQTLFEYDELLANEWRERAYTYLLREITADHENADHYASLFGKWGKIRPYQRGKDATAAENYPGYRKLLFNRFLDSETAHLEPSLRRAWQEGIADAEEHDLPAYQKQMSIVAYLKPEQYGEERVPLSLSEAHIGIIYEGHYYLIPVVGRDGRGAVGVNEVRQLIATLTAYPSDEPPANLTKLVGVKRTSLQKIRGKFSRELLSELDELRRAPIILNFDRRSPDQPLATLRQAERGGGDHALTIFDTGRSFVFDQSHIFFDGAWGAALAEIMTNEALAWAVYLRGLSPAQPGRTIPYSPALRFAESDENLLRSGGKVTPEASAESSGVRLEPILKLRRVFKQRNDLLQLTVNDLMILYRAIHGMTYRPSEELAAELKGLNHAAAREALDEIHDQSNPAILIPVDASQRAPRDRLYPMNFEVPLGELDLIDLHGRVFAALENYESASGDREAYYKEFDDLQKVYLAMLAGFGAVLSKAKEIANAGESASVGAIKLLAHMPTALQRLLDDIPGRFDVLNDIIKGREVFSNVGAVAPSSSLKRFISAKDDNDKKTLVWGVITDANRKMHLSLRDFRPHVASLTAAGYGNIAQRITEEYLDAYVSGFNSYIYELRRITLTSRETRLIKEDFDFNGD